MVGGTEVLCQLPGDEHFFVRFWVGGHRGLESVVLGVGELVGPGGEDVPDPVQRITATAAVTKCGLLDSSADFVQGGEAEFDDVKGIQHGGGVTELGVDGIFVPSEGIGGSDLDPGGEVGSAFFQPVAVDLSGAAGDQVQQPGVGLSLRISGEVHHSGQFPWASLLPGGVMPDVFIHTEGTHTTEAGVIGSGGFQFCFHAGPERSPGHQQLAAQASYGGVLPTHLAYSPGQGSDAEVGARLSDTRILFRERPDRTRRFEAFEPALTPHQGGLLHG